MEVATTTSVSDSTKVIKAINEQEIPEGYTNGFGTQFAEGIEPEIILIVLESSLILIEGTKLGIIAKRELLDRWEEEGEMTDEIDIEQIIEDLKKLENKTH